MGKRNNYFSKPRRSVNMWVIYVKRVGEKLYFPLRRADLNIVAFPTKASAAKELAFERRFGKAYLQKVGPIC